MRMNIILFVLCLFLTLAIPSQAAGSDGLKGKVVVVDPGHGGYDPGAVRHGVREKDINLQIALKLKESLEKKGAVVTLTRNGDFNLAVVGLHKREAHRYDLSQRLEVAHRSNADLFVSVHVNCIHSSSYRGSEVFYHPKSEKAKLLAECIQEQLNGIPGNKRRIAKTSQCYVLRNARITAVLIEAGYLSNSEDREKLLNSDYQKRLAERISSGIIKFYLEKGGGSIT